MFQVKCPPKYAFSCFFGHNFGGSGGPPKENLNFQLAIIAW